MKIDIAHIAKLANLKLVLQEEKKFEKQISAILEHFKKISEVSTDIIEETSQVTGLRSITRPDKIIESLTQKEALLNSKNIDNGNFVVPVILEEATQE